MYFSTVLTTLFLGVATALSLPAAPESEAAAAKSLVKVDLPSPDNWLTDRRLFPTNLIASYNAELDAYPTADAWNSFILDKCQGYTDCTSTASYQAINSGSTGGRYWFGEVYRGGATTAADYQRVSDPVFGVSNSQMYTIQA